MEKDIDRERLLRELGKLVIFVQNDNGLITRDDCAKILNSLKVDFDIERCEKEFLTIDELADFCKLGTDLRKREEQLARALQSFEDPDQPGMVSVKPMRNYLLQFMPAEEIATFLDEKEHLVELDTIVARLLKY